MNKIILIIFFIQISLITSIIITFINKNYIGYSSEYKKVYKSGYHFKYPFSKINKLPINNNETIIIIKNKENIYFNYTLTINYKYSDDINYYNFINIINHIKYEVKNLINILNFYDIYKDSYEIKNDALIYLNEHLNVKGIIITNIIMDNKKFIKDD